MRASRKMRRSRMIKSLQIVSTDAIIDCIILNLSKTGALVYLPKPLDVPEMVILRWPDGTERPARSCWRQDTDVGFEFLLSHKDDPGPLQGDAPRLVVFQSKERLVQISNSPEPRYTRRLSDQITASFYEACRIGNLDAAGHLVQALECEVARSTRVAGVEERYDGDDAAAVQARYASEVTKRKQERGGRGSSQG